MADKKRILWVHTQPEHYFNLLIDALNVSGEFEFIAGYLSKEPRLSTDLRIPKKSKYVFLRVRPGRETNTAYNFFPSHVDWREDVLSLNISGIMIAGYAGVTQRQIIKQCPDMGIPVMMMTDSNIRGQRNKRCYGVLKRSIKKKLLAPYIAKCTNILAMNSRGLCYWRYYGAPRDKVIQCPMLSDYASVENGRKLSRSDVMSQFNLPESSKIILYPARLIPLKRHDLVIDAFRAAGMAEHGWILVFAGSGPLEQDLKLQAGVDLNKSIHILGFVQPQILMPLLHHSNLMILASNYEAHGIVVGESACAGTPMLLSDVVGATRDLIKPGLSGWTFKSENISDLTQRMIFIRNNPVLLENMRQTTRAVFDSWYSQFNPVEIINSLWQRIFSGNGRS